MVDNDKMNLLRLALPESKEMLKNDGDISKETEGSLKGLLMATSEKI